MRPTYIYQAAPAIYNLMTVTLPPLLPDIEFEVLPKTISGANEAFEAKRDAMGAHIKKRWGWDEEFQYAAHNERFSKKPFFRIIQGGERIGVVSLFSTEKCVQFGEFYLLQPHRGNGLGSRILKHCLSQADEMNLPVKLEYLKWNPVGSLYLRHGFEVVGENDIHYFMERLPDSI